MRILTASKARGTIPDCAEYATRKTTASRDEVSRGGYSHAVYRAKCHGSIASAVESLLAYEIFAPRRMVALVCTPDRRVALGATIVQRTILGPVAVETAVRVVELQRSAEDAYFAYATLEGHVEQGLASFAVKSAGGEITFDAHAWSKPGSWLTALGRPLLEGMARALTREAVTAFCRRLSDEAR